MIPAALRKAVGRDQGPQLWFSSPFTPATAGNVQVASPSFADLSRPSIGVKIVLRYRATVGTAAYASLNAEAPQNLLQNVNLYGNRARTGATVPYNGSGATLFALNSFFKTDGVAARQFIGTFRQNRLSSPMGLTNGVPNTTGNFGGIGSFDIQSEYFVPFGPFGGNTAASTDNFGVKGASGSLAFTGYAGVGSPMVFVYLIPTLQAGNKADTQIINMYRAGVIQRNSQASQASMTTTATNSQLALLQNRDTPKIISKAGVVTALGDYSSLSDSIFTKQYLTVGGKPVVQLNDQWSQQGWYESKLEGEAPQGYDVIDFVGGGTQFHWPRIFRAPSGAEQFALSADITGAANQAAEIMQEQVLEQPVVAGN